MTPNTYKQDKDFLEQYLNIIELSQGQQRLLISPDLQGRVLTSTASGDSGYSFGWLNYDLLASGKFLPHCNNWGGEDRFWLGPEGGQFSLFFKPGTTFTFEEWQTPSLIDTEKWKLKSQSHDTVTFQKDAALTNCSGTSFSIRLERKVILENHSKELPVGVKSVHFRTENLLINTSDFEWTEETGMPSIWMLGQFIPSEDNTIIIPYRSAQNTTINDSYFGQISKDRLQTVGQVLLFKADGKKRGKIGIPPEMVMPVAGAYDAIHQILTIVHFGIPEGKNQYVNSMWEHQQNPFSGDVMNAYNDGPLEDGSMMGPFYELESSSPAAALKPGEILTHIHSTSHYTGELTELDQIARKILGISLTDLTLK